MVLTHRVPDDVPAHSVYHFVTDGVKDALLRARGLAADLDVAVMGGANVIQQYLNPNLIDEVSLHVVLVILGDGTRFFDALAAGHLDLELLKAVESPRAMHLRYNVVGR